MRNLSGCHSNQLLIKQHETNESTIKTLEEPIIVVTLYWQSC